MWKYASNETHKYAEYLFRILQNMQYGYIVSAALFAVDRMRDIKNGSPYMLLLLPVWFDSIWFVGDEWSSACARFE